MFYCPTYLDTYHLLDATDNPSSKVSGWAAFCPTTFNVVVGLASSNQRKQLVDV